MSKKKNDHWNDCIDAMLKRLKDHKLTAKLQTEKSRSIWIFNLYKNELKKMKAELWEEDERLKRKD